MNTSLAARLTVDLEALVANWAALYHNFLNLSFIGAASGVDLYCNNSAKL